MEYGVFLSYRRADTAGHAGRICDDLERRFRAPVIFRDVDAISAGSDFVNALESAVANATVAIILIGDTWLAETTVDGGRRIDDADDHVHREVAMMLGQPGITVVPVLVEGASMPSASQLPGPLRELARLQAIELSESRWEYDVERLAQVLRKAGVGHRSGIRLPTWVAAAAAALVVLAIAAIIWCWQGFSAAIDDYAGQWHLPNGSFWSVREKDGGLWVEETHHESRQVWKRGPARMNADGLSVDLDLVFDREPYVYLHRLSLSSDRQSLIGSVRRSDQASESSLVLTRNPPR